ncbi:MAG TPA: RHS repeat domain-containing protein [Flavipsychrobacter sp.]|nr:RHS repeat domain-containing protein [Flavipsychrobacter sp.]
MNRLLVAIALIIMLFACKKNNPELAAWQEHTRVADRYLTQIDFTDSFGVVRTETEIYAEAGNLSAVNWNKKGGRFFDGIVKDKEGRVATMLLNGVRKLHFSYDAGGRIVKKTDILVLTSDTVTVTSYSYDGQGRLQTITDPTYAREMYYTGNNLNADSQVLWNVANGSSTRNVYVYSYDIGSNPFNTLPDLVHYLDVDIRGSAGLTRNPIKTLTHYADGLQQSYSWYNCVYDAQGYLLMKVTNNKDTLKYYYNK